MAIYTSAPLRNDDPQPWIHQFGGYQIRSTRRRCQLGCPTRYAPRPEYDHQNPSGANPILAAARLDANGRTAELQAEYLDMWLFATEQWAVYGGPTSWDNPGHAYHVIAQASASQIEHAQRVLGKWMAVYA